MMQLLYGLLTVFVLCPISNHAFQLSIRRNQIFDARCRQANTSLRIIKADDGDFVFDLGSGGVRLASESVIKVKGSVKYKPGQADPIIKELIRYKSLTPVQESMTKSNIEKIGATIVCTGNGKELYKDPGENIEAVVVLAPADAVRDAFAGAGSAMGAGTLVLNFAGGDNVQVLQIIDATKQMIQMLDVATKTKIIFNSISTSEFPLGTCALTVVALPEDTSTGGLSGIDKAIASGEIYFRDGKYWTLVEDDINTAVA